MATYIRALEPPPPEAESNSEFIVLYDTEGK